MKLKCLHCDHEFDGAISKDDLGWHSTCPECGGSFDVDVPSGRIVMAFTDKIDDEDDPYRFFTDNFIGENIWEYFAYDTVEEFIKAWQAYIDAPDVAYGMWYWVLDNGKCVCSGACDPDDIHCFREAFGDWTKAHNPIPVKSVPLGPLAIGAMERFKNNFPYEPKGEQY